MLGVSKATTMEPLQQGTVMNIRDLSPSVRELTVAPERPISFAPGQWVSLKLPVGPRPPLVRAYSMAEPESPSGKIILVFDRVPDGVGSGYLFTLHHGDTIPLSGPYGHFVLPHPLPRELLFIARFTGIVPIRCIIKHLSGSGRLPPMTLIYNAPSQMELIYDDEFRQLASVHRAFNYRPFVQDSGQDSVQSVVQNHGDAMSHQAVPMIAGTKTFVRPLRARLTEIGFERRNIRHESYD
jgi:NAD(P)H-flavin reductase